MKWAHINGLRVEACPSLKGIKAVCPACGSDVHAKTGEILTWHWAHRLKDCDSWSEPESDWHKEWKEKFPSDWQEVVIGPHRADIKTPFGVLEFQKSSISIATIKKREQFYGAMAWVVDSSEWWLMKHDSYEAILPDGLARWLWPRKCWQLSSAPLFFDRGGNIIWFIKSSYQREGCRGKETIIEYDEMTYRQFIERWTGVLSSKYLLPPYHHPLYGYLKNRPDLLPPWPLGAGSLR